MRSTMRDTLRKAYIGVNARTVRWTLSQPRIRHKVARIYALSFGYGFALSTVNIHPLGPRLLGTS
jgi:hypothetical protein